MNGDLAILHRTHFVRLVMCLLPPDRLAPSIEDHRVNSRALSSEDKAKVDMPVPLVL
jgi:hypothetical protein